MKRVIKLSESDLTKIVSRVILENYYNPDKIYLRDNIVKRLKRGPKYLHKYINTLPHLKKEGSDVEYTKIPQVIYQYLFGSNF